VTADGGIVIGCRARSDSVVVEVWDSSPGAGPDLRREVFNPGAPYGRRLPDRGLGLVLASRLAVAMGGNLRFDSRAGGGNVLRLTLPAA
jgi:C4-dicarboxylate-specific signal transduction histidine kinase